MRQQGARRLESRLDRAWRGNPALYRLATGIGSDLQTIRISGTFVGGAIGLLLYGLSLVASRLSAS